MSEKNMNKNIWGIFIDSLCRSPKVWPKMALPVLFIVVVKDLYLYCGGMPKSPSYFVLVSIVMALLLIYFFCSCLVVGNAAQNNTKISLKQALLLAPKKIIHVYLALAFLVVLVIGFYFLGKLGVAHWGGGAASPIKSIAILFLFSMTPSLLFVVALFFSPLFVLLRDENVIVALKESFLISWFHWFKAFYVYAFFMIGLLCVLPISRHAHFFISLHILPVFDFVFLSVIAPIFVNFYLQVFTLLESYDRKY